MDRLITQDSLISSAQAPFLDKVFEANIVMEIDVPYCDV